MKTKYFFILLISVIGVLAIFGAYRAIIDDNINTHQTDNNIKNMITQKYKNLQNISIGERQITESSIFTVYSFKDSNLVNPNLNKFNIGICSVTNKNKNQNIEKNIFTTYKDEDDEAVVKSSNLFTQIGFYDNNTDRCVIGGRIFDNRINKIEIKFINGEVIQPVINGNGYFILIYNQNKFIKEKKSFNAYSDVISSIISYDVNNKPLKKIIYGYNKN